MRAGLSVAFLGIDGIGKSTLSRAFLDHLRVHGVDVVPVSWRSSLDRTSVPWPAVPLQQLWVESFRSLYCGGLRDSQPISIPRSYQEWSAGGWEARLAEAPVADNHASGALAAAFVEIAGNAILAAEVIRPALARGAVVVQESYPIKHVLKELAVSERLAGAEDIQRGSDGRSVGTLVRVLYDYLDLIFGSDLLRPDLGILVDGPASYAYRWRTAERGRVGALEDYGPAGERSEESFIALQEQTAERFRQFADAFGWLRHEVDDSGVEANTARGLKLLISHPEVARRLAT